jgi:hypothetical protein
MAAERKPRKRSIIQTRLFLVLFGTDRQPVRDCWAGFIATTSGFRFLGRMTIGFSGSMHCMIWSRKMNVWGHGGPDMGVHKPE